MFLCPHQIIWKINELYVKIDSTNVVYFGNTWIKIWDLVCPLLLIFMFLHSVLQGISPTLKYCPHPFLPSRLKTILNLSDPPPPLFYEQPSLKVLGNLTPHSFEMYPHPKKQHSFFKEAKDFISSIKK